MGVRDKHGNFRGKIGLMTFRMVNDTNVVQSRPGKGMTRMHAASMRSSQEFCLASNRSKMIRLVLEPLLNQNYDKKMVNRLNAAINKTIRSNPALKPGERDLVDGELENLAGFEFNMNSPFSEIFRQPMTVEVLQEGISLRIPEFNPGTQMTFPTAAVACDLKVILSAIDFEKLRYTHCEMKSLEIPEGAVHYPETQWLFNQHLPENVLLLLTAVLDFSAQALTGQRNLNSVDLNPVMLLGLFRLPAVPQVSPAPEPNEIWGTWFPIPGLNHK